MPSGHPDWQTAAGRSVGGESQTSYSFSIIVPAESSREFNLPVVASNTENIYQNITTSSGEDAFIHRVSLKTADDSLVFFWSDFITSGIYDFPGETVTAGRTVTVTISNYGSASITFIGVVNYVTRAV